MVYSWGEFMSRFFLSLRKIAGPLREKFQSPYQMYGSINFSLVPRIALKKKYFLNTQRKDQRTALVFSLCIF